MVLSIVTHTVENYERWLTAFDEHRAQQKRFGCTKAEVRRGIEDPNEVTILLTWPSPQNFQEFAEKSGLQEAMARGGVVGEPSIALVSDPVA